MSNCFQPFTSSSQQMLQLRPRSISAAHMVLIAPIVSYVETIHDRHSSCQFTRCLDLDIVCARLQTKFGIEQNCHRNWVGQADSAFACLR